MPLSKQEQVSAPLPLWRGRPVRDLVWLQTAFLGDIVLTTGAIALAARYWPEVRQHLITTPLGTKALRDFKPLTSCVALNKTGRGFRALAHSFTAVKDRLRAAQVETSQAVVLQVHRSPRSTLLTRFLGMPSITYRQSYASWQAGLRLERVATLHECARIGLLLEGLGLPREEIVRARPQLPAIRTVVAEKPWQQELVTAHEEGFSLVGIAPGSVWGTKRWPAESFASLACRMAKDARGQGLRFVLLGSDQERPYCEHIAHELQAAGREATFWNLAGATDLDDLRFVFPLLSLVVANDSSPIHYASAFNIPTIAVFGATVPSMGFGPLAEGSQTLGVDHLPCRPCSDHGPQECPLRHFRCMLDLSVGTVVEACWQALK